MEIGHENSVVNSALWAAAGDALGWMTELGRESTVVARTGASRVSEPVPWRRRIGGRGGVDVLLPAGTYSDDTQLRLAVCRAMQSNGDFDAEAFACVELTVWPSYALGAGKGSKAAAANLTKRGVNWFSNFFETKDQNYLRAGGNGAAMRVQPHVWVNRSDRERLVLSVLRDSLSTHGHTHGFCGAIFHALCLAQTFADRALPGITSWASFVKSFRNLSTLARRDGQLATFWMPAWTKAGDRSLDEAVNEFVNEALRDLEAVQPLLGAGPSAYGEILHRLGCFEDRYRGSGWKTALAATALCWLCREEAPETCLQLAANTLGSDTDTIGTMAGAILGVTANRPPDWILQDRDYIASEARRMVNISLGQSSEPFSYPDLSSWRPPATQSDSVSRLSGDLALAGFGRLKECGEPVQAGGYIWQWLALEQGQTIFAKRRAGSLPDIAKTQLPQPRPPLKPTAIMKDQELPLMAAAAEAQAVLQKGGNGAVSHGPRIHTFPKVADRIDRWTEEVIRSDFDDRVLGGLLNRYIDEMGSIEGAASFAAIVAKAKITRQRREMRR